MSLLLVELLLFLLAVEAVELVLEGLESLVLGLKAGREGLALG